SILSDSASSPQTGHASLAMVSPPRWVFIKVLTSEPATWLLAAGDVLASDVVENLRFVVRYPFCLLCLFDRGGDLVAAPDRLDVLTPVPLHSGLGLYLAGKDDRPGLSLLPRLVRW